MSKRSRSIFVRSLGIFSGIFVLVVRPSPDIIERDYVNGGYPVWQHMLSTITLHLPFSLGDVVKAAFIVFAFYIVFHGYGRSRRVPISERPAHASADTGIATTGSHLYATPQNELVKKS